MYRFFSNLRINIRWISVLTGENIFHVVKEARTSVNLDRQTRDYLTILAAERGLKVSPWLRMMARDLWNNRERRLKAEAEVAQRT
jgi:hypothetical protein